LSSRLDSYRAWKTENGIDRVTSVEDFKKFDDSFRAESNFDVFKWEKEWPPNDGFLRSPSRITLEPGILIDRYGSNYGSFVSPEGGSYRSRALKPGSDSELYKVFEVQQPIDVDAGTIKPWFGYEGMGEQYLLPDRVKNLIKSGVLKEVK